MGVQLVFVVEASPKCKSDWVYIKETIERFFKYDRAHDKLTPIYMNGKGNYESNSVKNKIKDAKAQYKGKTHVIYCFDCDEYDSKPEDKEFLEQAKKYCDSQGYEFVWFNRDIEQVFHGVCVDKNQKDKYAVRFKTNKMIAGF